MFKFFKDLFWKDNTAEIPANPNLWQTQTPINPSLETNLETKPETSSLENLVNNPSSQEWLVEWNLNQATWNLVQSSEISSNLWATNPEQSQIQQNVESPVIQENSSINYWTLDSSISISENMPQMIPENNISQANQTWNIDFQNIDVSTEIQSDISSESTINPYDSLTLKNDSLQNNNISSQSENLDTPIIINNNPTSSPEILNDNDSTIIPPQN